MATQPIDLREMPIYSVGEAARYLRIAPSTLSSWVKGRMYPVGGGMKPWPAVIDLADPAESLMSFNNLVEAHILKALRTRHGVPMRGVRRAIDYMRDRYRIDRLFLSDELLIPERKDEDGGRSESVGALFIEKYGEIEQISEGGQLVIKRALSRHLQRVERDPEGWPVRLFPFFSSDESKDVLIDPRISFGRPVLAKRGIRVATIADRVDAGEDLDRIAENYGLERDDVERALDFHEQAA